MASIKLKHASGNSTILNSPAANPTNDVTLKLPSTTGSAGQVLKVASANHSSTNAELEFAAAGGGKILKVESTTKTDIFSSTAVQTYTDITGLSVDITPTAAGSKILVSAHVSFGLDVSHSLVVFRFVRDSTAIAIADAANNRPRGTFASKPADDAHTDNACGIHLDTPSYNLGDTLTYKVQFYDYHANTFYVNRSFRHFDATTYDMVGVSNITVQEVGA